MITDLRTIPGDVSLDADLCIIGAGAAGIVIAREFISSNLKVIVLESGGYRRERGVQNLYSGDSIGEKYYKDLDDCRSRFLGGSTNCWGGIFTPLSEIDFEKRAWVPWSGWPVRFEEIRPWMRQANDQYGAGPYLYDSKAWAEAGIPQPVFDPERFHPIAWHYNSRGETLSYGKRFRQELRKAANIHVVLHANATELLTNESGKSVDRVRISTLEGKAGSIRARIFIVACGGIENPRLLLASTSTHRNGLGNDRDLVGRFFHEHLQMPCGLLAGPESAAARYAHLVKMRSTYCLAGLELSPSAQAAHRTLNGAISVDPFHENESALLAFQNIRSDLKTGKIGPQLLNNAWRVCREGNKLVPEAWRRVVHGDRPQGDSFVIFARGEQTPNPDSRVTLSRDVDPLGMRRACLDFRTIPLDREAIRLMARFARLEFKRLGLGQVIEPAWLEGNEWPSGMVEGPHHMGTTRMSDDAATGVVDRNCRVHGLNGLYIAGSSIFPTGGHANPTLAILAFAMRLAAHVREALAGSSKGLEWRRDSETGDSPAPKTSAAAVSGMTDPI
jgi:choline dehydrogenase-like flavoprotein